MARKKPESVADTKCIESGSLSTTDTRLSVQHVPIEGSRYLITIPADSHGWSAEELGEHFRRLNIEGAIIRLRPPEKASDDDVERVRKFFEGAKAERVIVLPRPRSELLPSLAASKVQKAVTARSAVTSLVDESNSKNKEALRKLCEHVMSKVGL